MGLAIAFLMLLVFTHSVYKFVQSKYESASEAAHAAFSFGLFILNIVMYITKGA